MEPTSGIASDTAALAHLDPADACVVETLIWLCNVPSPTGEEGPICDALVERLSRVPLAGLIRRHGDSIVVPVTRSKRGARRPRIALVGHTDVVRTVARRPGARGG